MSITNGQQEMWTWAPGNAGAATRPRPNSGMILRIGLAASNGDRSENADYQYGKRRLGQVDGRIRFLTKRIEAAEVVDPEAPRAGQAATSGVLRSDRALCQCRWSIADKPRVDRIGQHSVLW